MTTSDRQRLVEALARELVILLCDLNPGVTLPRARGDASIAVRHLLETGELREEGS